ALGDTRGLMSSRASGEAFLPFPGDEDRASEEGKEKRREALSMAAGTNRVRLRSKAAVALPAMASRARCRKLMRIKLEEGETLRKLSAPKPSDGGGTQNAVVRNDGRG